MLFNGLCGQPLTSLPLRYMFLWLIAPHTAVWQGATDFPRRSGLFNFFLQTLCANT